MSNRNETIVRLFTLWNIDKNRSDLIINSAEDNKINDLFLTEIMFSKLHMMGLSVSISLYGAALIELCVDSNPGLGQIVYSEIMDKIKPIHQGYEITAEDFVRRFDIYFPDVEISEIQRELETLWDKQKTETGSNSVDTYDYWKKYFNVKETVT